MLLLPVQFGQLKSRTIQSRLGNCTDFQRIIATLVPHSWEKSADP